MLRFEESVNTVGPRFRCELCGKTFLQQHNCLIHQLSICLPSKGVRRTTKENTKPGVGSEPTANVQLVDQPTRARHRTGENSSDQNKSLENKIELVREARTVNTTNYAPRLQSLSDEKLITGTVALMNIVQNKTKPTRPKKKKKYGCIRQFQQSQQTYCNILYPGG